MNIEQLRALYESARQKLHECRDALEAAEKRVSDAPDDADETTVAELRTGFDAAVVAFDDAATEATRCKTNLEDAERRQKAIDDHPETARAAQPADVRVLSEPAVYSERSEHSFFADAWRFKQGDPVARERLERHGKQNTELMRSKGVELRDVGTGAFAGLTIPQYLVELYAPLARAGAPFLAAVRKLPLPEHGLVISLSLITTGAATAAQAAENNAVQETDIDDTKLDINIRTYAGQQDISRQALERSEMVDAVVYADLVSDYYTKLDSSIINDDGTNGKHKGVRSATGIISVAYTDASPTVPELYPKVADCIQQIASTRFAPPLLALMHPRRWGWGTAALDTANRPLFVPSANGPFNALAVGDAPDYGAVVGQIQGLPVITDANLPTNLGAGTNEDAVVITRTSDLLFWQEGDGSPRQLRFEETAGAPQTVRLAVWGYSAFTAERYPKASGVIGGTGLVTPTF